MPNKLHTIISQFLTSFRIFKHRLLWLLPALLLLFTSVMGQPPSRANMRLADFQAMKAQKEMDMSIILSRYQKEADQSERKSLVAELEKTLYALFDISLRQKEMEVAGLQDELAKMKGNEAFQGKSTRIRELEASLAKVEGSLNFRKQNRDRIVQKRMAELVGKR
ncbi:MAG: hypothetical protein AAF206_12300 [Bacteroidota bacterium]